MISDEGLLARFRDKYSHIHPLLLQRSIERAKDSTDLFEILESIPKKPPFSWSEESRSWVKDMDVSAKKHLKKMISKKNG